MNSKNDLKTIDRMVDILDHLMEHDGDHAQTIAQELDLSRSTVYNHLNTLKKHGFIAKTNDTYKIGLRYLDMGIYARNQVELYHVAKPKVERLAEESKERTWCVTEENGLGVFIIGKVGGHSVETAARVGNRMHMHCNSSGKAMLAFMPREKVETIIQQYGLPPRTDATITNPKELFKELEAIKKMGYAINLEESIKGLHAVSAPIWDGNRNVIGAISIAGAAHRLSQDRINNEMKDLVLAVANEIELDLSYGDKHRRT
jgi:DNA-binding IclR family transcriptional regulator